MNKRRIIILVSVIGLILLLISTTYAYLRIERSQIDSNEASTLTCLDVSIDNVTAGITLTNLFAVPDEEGIKNEPYTFKVTNNCTTPVTIEMNLESLNVENALSPNYIKVSINNAGFKSPVGVILGSEESKDATIAGATSNNIDEFILGANKEKTFDLRLWVDEATTAEEGMNKRYEGKIVLIASPTNMLPAPNGWEEAEEGTLLAAIRNGEYKFSKTMTTPGQEVSLANEALISYTADDYGTSYYFRGAVENNYVVFANMCWRIVRVTGDGSIKLVLYNDNPNNIENPCSENGNSLAFARYDGTNYTSAFNTNKDNNAYIGYMHGNPNGTTYEEVHENKIDSTILTNLKTWYDSKLRSYNDMLADTIWCNDKTISSATSGTGIGTTNTYYAAYNRLYNISAAKPSLICPAVGSDGKLSKFTASDTTNGNGKLRGVNGVGANEYKVGLLTVDEVTFAGSGRNLSNNLFYLYQNTGRFWWTSTPSNYNSSYSTACEWVVLQSGALQGESVLGVYAVRPAVSLKDSTIISSGTGTASDPYVITLLTDTFDES